MTRIFCTRLLPRLAAIEDGIWIAALAVAIGAPLGHAIAAVLLNEELLSFLGLTP